MGTPTSSHLASSGAPEASSATGTIGTRVALDATGLHLRDVTITDPDVLAGLRRHLAQHTDHAPSPAHTAMDATGPVDQAQTLAYVHTALALGARALTVVGTSLDAATLERSVADLTHKVETSTQQALSELTTAIGQVTDSEHGTIPRTIATTLDKLADQVASLVAGEDAPVRAAVTDSVRTVTEQALAEIQRAVGAQADAVRRVLATDAPGSPLHDLKTGLVAGLNESHRRLASQLAELRTALEVDKATTTTAAAAAAKSPRHGLDTETTTLAAVEQIAHTAGDQLEATGTTPGILPRCLKGDGVITLTPPPGRAGSPSARIVVEVKDRDRPQSPTSWKTLLDEARQNRQAVAALGIVKTTAQMPGQRRLHALDADNYLLAYDPDTDGPDLLVAVYHLLRAQAWHTTLTEGSSRHDVDLPRLKSTVTALADALTGFDALTRHTHAARRSLDQLDKTTTSLRADLHTRVQATLDALTPRAETAAA
ncbi:MAG: hypothetical protein ACTHOK_21105 [Nocardioidaceae bacterium]